MKPPRCRKVVLVNCRLTAAEMKDLKSRAWELGASVSEYIRSQLFPPAGVETRVSALEVAIQRLMERKGKAA